MVACGEDTRSLYPLELQDMDSLDTTLEEGEELNPLDYAQGHSSSLEEDAEDKEGKVS